MASHMRTWPGHRRAAMVDSFSVDQSVFLPAGDLVGIQRLMQYSHSPLARTRERGRG